MTYELIGTGNMAWLIASRMAGAGHVCMGVWGRNPQATDELCAAFSLPRLQSLSPHRDGSDACIVAVADSAIADLVQPFSLRHSTLIHTAGAVHIDTVASHSVHAGVVWPVYSIRKANLPDHRNFAALIEANTPVASEVVRAVANAICDSTYDANSEQRQWLHLAAVMGNNFVNHLLGVATDICAAQDLPVSLLNPLLEQPLMGMQYQHPAMLQTGPARRHDATTMEQHISMLAAHPQWEILYTTLSQAIMDQFPLPAKG